MIPADWSDLVICPMAISPTSFIGYPRISLQATGFCQNGNFHACADLICQNSSAVPLAAFLPDRVFCEWADKRNGLKEFPLSHSYPYYITFSVLSGTAMHKHVLETLFQLLSFAFKDK